MIGLAVALAAALGAHASRPAPVPRDEGACVPARAQGDFEDARFEAVLGAATLRIRAADGSGTFSTGGRERPMRLPLPEGGLVEGLYVCAWRGDLVAVYAVTDGDSGWGHATRLDGRTLAPRWVAPVAGFNVGEPLLTAGHLYVGAIGVVGKLDLDTGKYAWEHHGLYRSVGAYESFLRPRIENGHVLFPARHPGRGRGDLPSALVVDDATGRILEGAPPPELDGGSP